MELYLVILFCLMNNLSDARRVTTLFRNFIWKARVLGMKKIQNFNHDTLTEVRAKWWKKIMFYKCIYANLTCFKVCTYKYFILSLHWYEFTELWKTCFERAFKMIDLLLLMFTVTLANTIIRRCNLSKILNLIHTKFSVFQKYH